MRTRLAGVGCAAVLALHAPAAAAAGQVQDFSGLRLQVGDRVVVVDRATGVETSGRVTSVGPQVVVVDGRAFTPRAGLTIVRRGDPVWNGVAIGAGVGVVAGLTIAAEACLDRSKWRCAATGAAIYGLIGAAIDAAMKGSTTVYRSNQRASHASVGLHVGMPFSVRAGQPEHVPACRPYCAKTASAAIRLSISVTTAW